MNFSGFSVLREYFNSGDGLGKDSALYTLVQLSPSTPPQSRERDRGKPAPRCSLLRHIAHMAGDGRAESDAWALPLAAAAAMPLSARHPVTALTCVLSHSGKLSLLHLLEFAAAPRQSVPRVPMASAAPAVAAHSPAVAPSTDIKATPLAPAAANPSHTAVSKEVASPEPKFDESAPGPGSSKDEAATKIQAMQRGRIARQQVDEKRKAAEEAAARKEILAIVAPAAPAAERMVAPAPAKPPADLRPIPLRPPKHTSSPFHYHSRCSGGSLGFVFDYTMALETDKPPLISLLTSQASAPPRDAEAAKLATIAAVRFSSTCWRAMRPRCIA